LCHSRFWPTVSFGQTHTNLKNDAKNEMHIATLAETKSGKNAKQTFHPSPKILDALKK